jgi:hypothetical protein
MDTQEFWLGVTLVLAGAMGLFLLQKWPGERTVSDDIQELWQKLSRKFTRRAD